MKQFIIHILLFILTIGATLAQKISMDRIELRGNYIEVFYTLEDSNPNHEYQVDLYSSKDNFAVPLTKVSGQVGLEVKPSEKMSIIWNAGDELGNYKGELSLEVRARVYIPFVKITSFDSDAKFKRGAVYPLIWESGNKGGQIDIELYKDQSRVGGDRNVPNNGKYEYAFPGSVKPGKEYRLKFTNTRNRDESAYTGYFVIKPKIPFVLKVGVLAGVAAGAYLILTNGSGGGSTENPNPELPGHPEFPPNP